jgi:hypothetical protein
LRITELQQGILLQRTIDEDLSSKDMYSFSHLTIQEYLAANYIASQNRLDDYIYEYLSDQNWKETILMLTGLIPNRVDDLLLLIEKRAQEYKNSDLGKQHLLPLIEWCNKVTIQSSNISESLSKRCLAVAFASANAYAYSYGVIFARSVRSAFENVISMEEFAYNSSNALSNIFSMANCYSLAYSYNKQSSVPSFTNPHRLIYAYALAQSYSYTHFSAPPNVATYLNSLCEFISYAKNLQNSEIFNNNVDFASLIDRMKTLKRDIPSVHDTQHVHKRFSKIIINTWLNAFCLNDEIFNIPRDNIDEIGKNYFYLNCLIFQCSDIAISISNNTWDSILSRILRP